MLKGVPHKPLLVIVPKQLLRFLNAYSTLEDLDMQFLDCRQTLKPSVVARGLDTGDAGHPFLGSAVGYGDRSGDRQRGQCEA